MANRIGYLLTCNPNSSRCLFSKDVLHQIGFNVSIITCIPHENKVLSNKISMQFIYELIKNSPNEYCYVFEDDINLLQPITLDEITQYETISDLFFYLGLCEYYNGILINFNIPFVSNIHITDDIKLDTTIDYTNIFFEFNVYTYENNTSFLTNYKINGHNVYSKSGYVRGLHAIGLSKKGAEKLLEFSKNDDEIYMDVILEKFTLQYPANCVRYDLESYIKGHKGIIFQDRNRFASEIM